MTINQTYTRRELEAIEEEYSSKLANAARCPEHGEGCSCDSSFRWQLVYRWMGVVSAVAEELTLMRDERRDTTTNAELHQLISVL